MAKKKEKAEEPEEDEESSFGIKKIIKVLVGIALIVVGIGSYWYWLPELLVVVKGCLGVFIALIGLVVVMIAWSD
jgi:hypothetical protein